MTENHIQGGNWNLIQPEPVKILEGKGGGFRFGEATFTYTWVQGQVITGSLRFLEDDSYDLFHPKTVQATPPWEDWRKAASQYLDEAAALDAPLLNSFQFSLITPDEQRLKLSVTPYIPREDVTLTLAGLWYFTSGDLIFQADERLAHPDTMYTIVADNTWMDVAVRYKHVTDQSWTRV